VCFESHTHTHTHTILEKYFRLLRIIHKNKYICTHSLSHTHTFDQTYYITQHTHARTARTYARTHAKTYLFFSYDVIMHTPTQTQTQICHTLGAAHLNGRKGKISHWNEAKERFARMLLYFRVDVLLCGLKTGSYICLRQSRHAAIRPCTAIRP
jgi:hypothetical protein